MSTIRHLFPTCAATVGATAAGAAAREREPALSLTPTRGHS
jgi:hypothetical protein